MAGVRFEGVTKRFGATTVLDRFDLEVPDGAFLALLGPSGSGKSTALRLLAGLERPTMGTIRIGDRVVNDLPPRERDIAMVFQSYALYPHMSVYDNIGFGLELRGTPKAEISRRVQAASALLGIEGLLDRRPGQLSGGQRQRVAVARAIVREPKVFLLDEPLSNLDAKLRVQTRAEISRLHRRLGTTFVYVTHDQAEAMTMAGIVAVLNQGRIQQKGSPQDLYQRPANVFVAGFIGSPAMNFFRVAVVPGTAPRLAGSGLEVPLTPSQAKALEDRSDGLILGIRPEDIHAMEYTPPGIRTCPLRARVDVTEWLGSDVFLHVSSGEELFLARVDPRVRAAPGEEIDLALDLDKLHLFDARTEERVFS